jgi:hypothetical protein
MHTRYPILSLGAAAFLQVGRGWSRLAAGIAGDAGMANAGEPPPGVVSRLGVSDVAVTKNYSKINKLP